MADSNILSDFGIKILEQEIDDVIFQTNEFLCDATFTGSQGPFWWILQMCMALAALFSIVVAGSMAYKMMVKHEPIDIMKLFKPLVVSVILCWWYPPADTGITNNGSSWCVLDFLSYIPNCIGSYTHDLYEAESAQIEDKFEEVQELIYTRDTLYNSLQAQADVAHSGTSDPNLIESTMEQAGVDEVTNMETDASKLWFTSLSWCGGRHRQGDYAHSIDCLPHWLVGNNLLPTDTPGYVNDIRSDTMGILSLAEMGRSLGKVADTLSHGTFLWSNAILRGLLCPFTL